MKHSFYTTLFALSCTIATAFAQRNVTSFNDYRIEKGSFKSIAGQKRYEPDIYYTKNPNGNYTAHRLTVQPNGQSERVSQPYIYAVRPDGVTIGWKTRSEASGSQVLWGESPDKLINSTLYSSEELSSVYYWNHATLTNLTPDRVYYYQVKSNGVESDIYRFRTLPQDGHQGVMRFLLFGDHQRNLYSDYEWLLRMAERKLNEKYGEKPIEDHVSFIMNMGDQVDQATLKQYEEIHRFKNRYVMSHLPIQTVVGNHDTYGDTNMKFYNGHYSAYRKAAYKGLDAGTANYYAYQAGRVLWIGINSDGASNQQKEWIRKVVNTADADPTVDCIISVQHRPLYAEMYSNDVSAWMLNEIMPILDSSSKHVMNCSGHHHLYARGQMPNSPVYHVISGGGVGIAEGGYLQLWGETDIDIYDHDHVQATIDHWTYQIVEYNPSTYTMTVECYSVGNKRIALDNVMVDSFSRNLRGETIPSKPSFTLANSKFELPARIEQNESEKGLHSAHYQISKQKDFSSIDHERILTFENFYKVDKNYLPLNQYAMKPVTRLELEEGTLATGTYYLRARNRNMNLDYSDWSETQTIQIIDSSSDQAIISLGKNQFSIGEKIDIDYMNASVETGARIAIYSSDNEPGPDSAPIAVQPIEKNNGKLTFELNQNGKFYAVVFNDASYTECSDRLYFCVGQDVVEFSLQKHVFDVGDPVKVCLFGTAAKSKDWIGIYAQGINPSSTTCPTWKYVGSKPTVNIDLNVPGTQNYKAPLTAGTYFVNYFKNDGYEEAYDREYFVIGMPCQVSANTETASVGAEITFQWNGLPENTPCRLVRKDSASGAWITIAVLNVTEGTVSVDNLPEGEHNLSIILEGKRISNQILLNIVPGVGIENTSGGKKNGTVYTLDGRRLDKPRQNNKVYIIDGRKYLN